MMTQTLTAISIAKRDEYPLAQGFLEASGYRGDPITDGDEILLARLNGTLAGVVRLSPEAGFLCLRGMRVRAEYQRQGIGTAMLALLTEIIGDRPCFCLPYRHLEEFYGQFGFIGLDPKHLPSPLNERLTAYRHWGLDVIGMVRRTPPQSDI